MLINIWLKELWKFWGILADLQSYLGIIMPIEGSRALPVAKSEGLAVVWSFSEQPISASQVLGIGCHYGIYTCYYGYQVIAS